MKDVIIIGTGGHAKATADIVLSSGDNLVGFLTSDSNKTTFLGKPVLGSDADYEKYKDHSFIIAIGNAATRQRIAETMPDAKWYTAVHPKAYISAIGTTIGPGTVVMPNTVIQPHARIGSHCIINTGALVEHDNTVRDFSHISVGAKLAGNVTIGQRTWVGISATVKDGVHICDDCMIGAGAVVVKDITRAGTYVGVPAQQIK